MANHTIIFDPDSRVPHEVNLTINTGSEFKDNFSVITNSNSPFNFNGWTGSSQMAKSVSIGSSSYAKATFNVGFTSSTDGKFSMSLSPEITRTLKEGRYVYDILVSSGTTTYRIVDGNIIVRPGISSAP